MTEHEEKSVKLMNLETKIDEAFLVIKNYIQTYREVTNDDITFDVQKKIYNRLCKAVLDEEIISDYEI